MRQLSAEFSSHIASGATNLCWCWKIVRTDGVTLGFTDHDQPLSFDALTYQPAHGLDGGEVSAKLGAGVDTSEVLGVLHNDAISDDDLTLGRYDGATVTTFRVNWLDTSVRDRQRVDTIGEITREDGLFRAELRSQQQAMNIVRGRRYQRLCDADLGDGRCGVDIENATFKAAASVVQIVNRHTLNLGTLSGFAKGWFSHGKAIWSDGQRVGLTDGVIVHALNGSDHLLSFALPVGDWVEAGDALTLYVGCDKAHATCRLKFANIENFRGFPHIPGSDFLLRYPLPGDTLDGGPLVS